MPKQYFLKRGDKLRGPFDGQQVKAAIASKNVFSTDQISETREGPWQSIGDLIASAKKRSLPTVTQFEMSKTVFGTLVANYVCPFCKAELRSTEKELDGNEACPECNRQFLVSIDALAKLRSERQRVEKAQEQVRRKRQTKKEEKQREKERQQQQIRAQQRLKEQQRVAAAQRQQELREETETEDGNSIGKIVDATQAIGGLFSLFSDD